MSYEFKFPKSFAACEVVRLTACICFSSVSVWLGSMFPRADQGGSRQAGGRLWISLDEPGPSASAHSDWAVATVASLGEKVPSACPL